MPEPEQIHKWHGREVQIGGSKPMGIYWTTWARSAQEALRRRNRGDTLLDCLFPRSPRLFNRERLFMTVFVDNIEYAGCAQDGPSGIYRVLDCPVIAGDPLVSQGSEVLPDDALSRFLELEEIERTEDMLRELACS
jgi:hypothetical protein